MTSRRWCFTLFTPTQDNDDISLFDTFTKKLKASSYYRGACWQIEQAPETQRLHLQGYIEFNTPLRLASLRKIDTRVHWEPAKGNRQQCIAYCQKEETRAYSEFPESRHCDPILLEKQTQGRRSDLIDCARSIALGTTTREQLYTERPDLILKYSRGVGDLFRFAEQRQRNAERNVVCKVLYGDPGSGKTRYAYNFTPDVFILENSNSDNVWWDGYNGESTLIIDDFYGWIKHNQLLRLLDRYPCRLDVKGGTTYACWTTVFITSNAHPSKWYKKFPWDDDGALRRRITEIWNCKKNFNSYTWEEESTGAKKCFDNDFIQIN